MSDKNTKVMRGLKNMSSTPYEDSLLATPSFWKVVLGLRECSERVVFQHFLEKNSISEKEFYDAKSFMENIDFPFEIEEHDETKFLVPVREWLTVHLDFHLVDWLSLQAHLPLLDLAKKAPYYEVLFKKIDEIKALYPDFDINDALDSFVGKIPSMTVLSNEFEAFFPLLSKAQDEQVSVDIKLKKGGFVKAFTHQVSYLDGVLSIIGEDCEDRCLISLSLSEIDTIDLNENTYTPNFSLLEVKDFISAIRNVGGDEVRLVMKVRPDAKIDLNPKFHFLGDPYVTENMNGDFIWAASVEISNELFEWLYEIKDGMEILDPSSLIKEFYAYCASRSSTENSSFKKAA